jgi:hypothetical protein
LLLLQAIPMILKDSGRLSTPSACGTCQHAYAVRDEHVARLLAGRALRFSRATTGALMLTGDLANTSIIGLPMIETFYGPQFLGLGILGEA